MFTTWLVVCEQVVKNTTRLKNVDFPESILFVLVEVRYYRFLEVGQRLLECFRFFLLNFTHEVIELESLLIVDAYNLFGTCLKQSFDSSEWGDNSDVLCEFRPIELSSILELPNLELTFIEGWWHNITQISVWGISIASYEIRWIFKFDDGANTGFAVWVGVKILDNLFLFNVPDLHFAHFGANYDKVFIDLEKCRRSLVVLELVY